jgi:hypothetical protein
VKEQVELGCSLCWQLASRLPGALLQCCCCDAVLLLVLVLLEAHLACTLAKTPACQVVGGPGPAHAETQPVPPLLEPHAAATQAAVRKAAVAVVAVYVPRDTD